MGETVFHGQSEIMIDYRQESLSPRWQRALIIGALAVPLALTTLLSGGKESLLEATPAQQGGTVSTVPELTPKKLPSITTQEIVKSGDSLWSLNEERAISTVGSNNPALINVATILTAHLNKNTHPDPDRIHPGQQINILTPKVIARLHTATGQVPDFKNPVGADMALLNNLPKGDSTLHDAVVDRLVSQLTAEQQ